MPRRHMIMTGADGAALRAALRELRTKLEVPEEFPAPVLAEAERAVRTPRLPDFDATDIPFFTIDPPASRDLDQAMHLAKRPSGGYRVHYAIADVAAYVTPGGALDAEAHRRVTTLYFPDEKVPLHPAVLSEGAASLLPDQTCPALLWRLDLDAEGRVEGTEVRRALVRSRAKLDYDGVQKSIDGGTAEEPLALLKDIGRLREALEAERGGISLNVPEQEIVEHEGSYSLVYRAPLPADGWNAQISLMTGMAAAELMLTAGTGILRTLPTAPDGAVGRLRRAAKALRIEWPHHVPYAELVRGLDPHRPAHAAFLQECTALLRGAGYTVFTGGRTPDPVLHAAVAAPYAHCTAPLRRLVDRYTGELCVAAVAGTEPPGWALEALDALPKEMSDGTRLANSAERESVDLVEAALLKDRVGETFEATVIDVKDQEPLVGTVHLEEPAVIGRVESTAQELPLGDRIRVRLTEADPGRAKVLFAPA
ncbi:MULTISPECIES: RNB domain-containing ribonuclease [unclassified Streptomyces]|uniref:RNB domain-containing ribonuclease n=1 Tax=unclassified Streptomyces TaxID=2593676 RepID=UPI00202EBB96|nr:MULTISPECIES: RNB domain-containing ribonuclease [unclassified Streptomyces]MCM1970019.1 RNB domain-containing ribonuclease [Streptomyces sp. G1]MCX5125473.1 RNB domain-containing ribonuclease [Streptomyces sp. NBC_00347]MCX5298715.1 RNB domain-containing ribonuclease [Streptomyces sp. NBC_00193]